MVVLGLTGWGGRWPSADLRVTGLLALAKPSWDLKFDLLYTGADSYVVIP